MRFTRLRWLTPQKRTPRYLSGRVMHVVLRVDASPVRPLLGRATFFVGHVAAYGLIRFSFVSFSSSCLRLHLVALFFSSPLIDIATRLLALPLFSTSRPLSRIDYHSFSAFNLDTEHFSHTTPRGLSPAGLSLSPFPFSLSYLLLPLRSVHSLYHPDSMYKHLKPCVAERQATVAPVSLSIRLRSFPGNRGPFSVLPSFIRRSEEHTS